MHIFWNPLYTSLAKKQVQIPLPFNYPPGASPSFSPSTSHSGVGCPLIRTYNTPKNEFRKLQHFVPLSLTFWRNSNLNVPAHFFICWDKTTPPRSQLKLIFYNLPRNWAKSPSAERILDIFSAVFPLRGQDSWDSCQFWKWLKWTSAEINDQYFTNFSSEHAILLFE